MMTVNFAACNCDPVGTIPTTVCDSVTGQCECQPNIEGRQCDQCIDNYYDLQVAGCKRK